MRADQDAMHLATRIKKEILDVNGNSPNGDVCVDLAGQLKKIDISMKVLEETKIGKLVTKATKSIKRHKRTETDEDQLKNLQLALEILTKLLDTWKEAADSEAKAKVAAARKKNQQQLKGPAVHGLPSSSVEYRNRLVIQKKELYKDPPVLPPGKVVIEPEKCPPPKRNKFGEFSFVAGDDESIQALLADFHPNRSPEEVLRAGSFGGTYFRPITSAVTNIRYDAKDVLADTVKGEWIKGIPMVRLTSSTYQKNINKFKVQCGGSLGMWESSGWIVDSDPYGWFQWYCRFYQGRRCSDDKRQISRWCKSAGPKGRFRSQLCNKIIAAGRSFGDSSISPVIRQTLLHWGLEITSTILEKHRKRVGK